MPAINKLLLGAIATFLLGWLVYAPMGFGARFIDGLESQVRSVGQNIPNSAAAQIQFDRSGPLYRRANGFGPGLDDKARVAMSADYVEKTPGLFSLDWTERLATAAQPVVVAADTGKPATLEEVKSCQEQVDGAIKGKTISFESGGSLLTAESQPLLDTVAAALGPCSGTRIEVAGHTDAAGGFGRNMRLSEERANSVVEALMARGIPGTRLAPKGYGEAKPLDTGATPEAFARNRRIEFAVAAASGR